MTSVRNKRASARLHLSPGETRGAVVFTGSVVLLILLAGVVDLLLTGDALPSLVVGGVQLLVFGVGCIASGILLGGSLTSAILNLTDEHADDLILRLADGLAAR